MNSEEKFAWAGEYVLGTLTYDERQAFERASASDADLAAARRYWENQLAELNDLTPPLAPPRALWDRISVSIAQPSSRNDELLVSLKRRLAGWRTAAMVTGALAAAMVAILLARPEFGPYLDQRNDRYVAVIDQDGDLPALLVDVDLAAGTISIRSVTADAPEGRSHELWYIVPGRDPLSLGLVDRVGMEIIASLEEIPDFQTADVVFAISNEPLGGSPTGAPTGQIVYTGALFPAPGR